MKKSIFFFIIIIINSLTFSNTSYNLEYLTNNKWGPDTGQDGYYLDLNSDYTYTIGIIRDGYWDVTEGTYKIINSNTISLTDQNNNELFYVIEKNNTSVFSNECLRYIGKETIDNNFLIFWNINNKVKENDEKLFFNKKVIIIHKNAVINTKNVFLRDGPSIQSIKCKINFKTKEYGDQYDDNLYAYHLPPNYKVKTICRTKEKDHIKKWNNYWYYIDISHGPYIAIKAENDPKIIKYNFVWIYGEFLNFK